MSREANQRGLFEITHATVPQIWTFVNSKLNFNYLNGVGGKTEFAHRLRRGGFGGFVVAGDGPQGNSQAIPRIDNPDHKGEVHNFFFTEMRL
jgi:hypothetical protein